MRFLKYNKVHSDGEWMVNLVRGKTRDMRRSLENKKGTYFNNRIKREIKYRDIFRQNGLGEKCQKESHKCIVQNKKEGGDVLQDGAGVIFADGSVYPCEMLESSFGNLRDFDYNLGKLWKSRTAKEVRNRIQDSTAYVLRNVFFVNFLIQPQLWPG